MAEYSQKTEQVEASQESISPTNVSETYGLAKSIIMMRVLVTPLRPAVLPPLSSKVLKYVVEKRGGLLGGLVAERGGYKPLFISMLYRGSQPLYSRGGGSGPVSVEAGEVLWARISLVTSYRDAVGVLEEGFEGVWDTPYGVFRVEVAEAVVEKIDALSLGGATGVLKIRARTPVVLTSKTLLGSSDPDVARRVPRVHRLVPSPGLIAAYSLRLWNRVVGLDSGLAFIWRDGWNLDAYMVARAAEVYMAELDYSVRPETVIVGRDSSGRLRRARGWVGWVVYRVLGRRLAKLLDKTLALASRIGLGRSRGIGLGDINAEWVRPRERS